MFRRPNVDAQRFTIVHKRLEKDTFLDR